MRPTSEDCKAARKISEARQCAHRDEFIGAVGVDVLPHLLPHDQKLKRALLERDRSGGKRVVDTPLVVLLAALVLTGCLSGLALAAGLV